MVLETWNNIDLDDKNKMVRFKKKLQILKKEIRSWVNDCKKNQSGRLVDLRSKLCHIDKVIDQGGVNDDILLTRLCFFCESKNQVCLLCEVILKQIPAFNFFCASLESISAIENYLGMVRDCQHGTYTAGEK
ncbi:hypothetical protein Tco_0691560 [Tanacetum coccineum]